MEQDKRGEGGGVQAASSLRKRRVTLADGRYLIFYTFEQGAQQAQGDAAGSKPEPAPQNVAEEERRV